MTITREQAEQALLEADNIVASVQADLDVATDLSTRLGYTIEPGISWITATPSTQTNHGGNQNHNNTAQITTAGHVNTDHQFIVTGHAGLDLATELARTRLLRYRAEQPESRGDAVWDKPRVKGERRRRIARHKDAPTAPPEPPPSGYSVFTALATTKIRHDNPNVPHNQAKAIREISQAWNHMSTVERDYYTRFYNELTEEHRQQMLEFRACGVYQPSPRFGKVQGVGPWVHLQEAERNALEDEVFHYETVVFPMRPAEDEAAYQARLEASIERRKAKLRAEREEAHKNGTLVRRRKRRRTEAPTTAVATQPTAAPRMPPPPPPPPPFPMPPMAYAQYVQYYYSFFRG